MKNSSNNIKIDETTRREICQLISDISLSALASGATLEELAAAIRNVWADNIILKGGMSDE